MADEKKTYLINIESNLKKYAEEAAEAKKKVDDLKVANDLLKQSGTASAAEIEVNNAALRNAQKEYNQAKKMVDLSTAANNSNTNSRKQLGEILNLEMLALGKLGNGMIKNKDGALVLNKAYVEQQQKIANTKKAIIDYDQSLNDGRSNIGRYSESMTSAFSQIGSAAGGTFGKISEGAEQVGSGLMNLVKGGGVMALVTAAISVIAKVWKDAKEKMDLYLASADKLKYAGAGFEKDAETARIDTRKRAQGQINEGYRIEQEYRKKLDYAFGRYTDLEKESFRVKIASGKQMQIDGKIILDQVRGAEDKVGWEMKYNDLLTEQEIISDNKLAKETEWEGLEAGLMKQRAIVSASESTSLQKKQAAIDADIIASKLLKEKTEFIDKELINVRAIAEMTGKQEVYEDQVNGLLKERNTIKKEYSSDQVKINKLDKTANADNLKAQADRLKTQEEFKKLSEKLIADYDKSHIESLTGSAKLKAQRDFGIKQLAEFRAQLAKLGVITAEQDALFAGLGENVWNDYLKGMLKAAKNTPEQITAMSKSLLEGVSKLPGLQKGPVLPSLLGLTPAEIEEADKNTKLLVNAAIDGAQKGADAVFDIKRSNLQASMEAELSNENLTEAQRAKIKKKYAKEGQAMAIGQALINGAIGITKTFAEYGFTPPGWIAAALLAVSTAAQIAVIAAQKFDGGGGSGSLPTAISSSAPAQRTFAQSAGSTILTQPQLSQTQLNALPQQGLLTAADIAAALSKMPPPVVTVEDINAKVNEVQKIKVNATI